MRRTGQRALRHHLRRHRLLPHLLERRGVLSRALLADVEQRRDGVLVRTRGQLAHVLRVPPKRDLVALALQLLPDAHALRVRVRVHDDLAVGGGARSGREPARAVIVPLVVAQADLVVGLGLLEIPGVLPQQRVNLRVAHRHPERIARDVLLGDLKSEVGRAARVDAEPKVGPAVGVVHEAVHAPAQLIRTGEAVVGLDAEPLERRRDVQVTRILQSQSLLLED